MPRVLNVKDGHPQDRIASTSAAFTAAVVLFLPASKWGNPYQIDVDGTRDEVIARYRVYLLSRLDLSHGDVLPELANA